MDDIEELRRKAELFDALMSCERIIVHTSTGLGHEKYQHIAVEMWTKHLGSDTPEVRGHTECSRNMINTFLRTQANALRKG